MKIHPLIMRHLCVVIVSFCSVHADPPSLSRYALVIGSNRGSEDRVELKYAISDAESFAQILVDMGGVESDHCIVAANPDRKTVVEKLAQLQATIAVNKNSAGRKEVIVYYSGHADENGLLLGAEAYSYREIRNALQTMGADVRIAVLDACASGNLTRTKGGKHRPPFLLDAGSSMEGYAFLTSSSSTEASQESDALRSSFFTHYLISGMRGPADGNGDGKVTLNEAYEFSYDKTLQRTAKTKAGPQHAAYDIRLKGTGDLVLTDVRTSKSRIRLTDSLHGNVYIHDAQGHLLVELVKIAGKPLDIGLEPGTFEVVVSMQTDVLSKTVTLTDGGVTEIAPAQLTRVKKLEHRIRGSVVSDSTTYAFVPVNLAFIPAYSIGNLYPRTRTFFSLSILAGKTDILQGIDISSGLSIVDEQTIGTQIAAVASIGHEVTGLQLSGVFNQASGSMNGLQISGTTNYTHGTTHGLQLTGAINIAKEKLTGLQLAGACNHLHANGKALQLAGGYNFTTAPLYGMQLSGGANLAGASMTGFQLTGGANVSAGDFSGIRIAGGVNIAPNVHGFQLAGGCNITRTCTGVQIAPFNICGSMNGFQLGVVNICDTTTGCPIGVFTFVRTIPPRFRLFFDESGFMNLVVRSGAEQFYSLFSLASSSMTSGNYQWEFGLGLGGRIFTPFGYVGFESTAHHLHENSLWDRQSMMHIRNSGIVAFRLFDTIHFFAGPTFNLGVARDRGKERISLMNIVYKRYHTTYIATWPGVIAGMEW